MKSPRAFWGPGTTGVQLSVRRSSSVGTTKKWTSTAGVWVRMRVLRSGSKSYRLGAHARTMRLAVATGSLAVELPAIPRWVSLADSKGKE